MFKFAWLTRSYLATVLAYLRSRFSITVDASARKRVAPVVVFRLLLWLGCCHRNLTPFFEKHFHLPCCQISQVDLRLGNLALSLSETMQYSRLSWAAEGRAASLRQAHLFQFSYSTPVRVRSLWVPAGMSTGIWPCRGQYRSVSSTRAYPWRNRAPAGNPRDKFNSVLWNTRQQCCVNKTWFFALWIFE